MKPNKSAEVAPPRLGRGLAALLGGAETLAAATRYETVIPRNVRVSEAPSHGKPVLLYDLKCSGSQAYLKLASEVIQRERGAA